MRRPSTCRRALRASSTPSSSSPSTTIVWLTEDALYTRAYLSSLWIALVSTFLVLLVGYPIAYGMARAPKRLAADAADAGHPAVLDVVPDPRLRLDRHPQEGRAAQPAAPVARRHRRAADHPQHQLGGLYRHRLFLPAVHGAAALRRARAARRHAARSGRRSRLPAGQGLLEDHLPAVAARRHRRLLPGLHPGRPASSSSPTCSAARER